MIAEIIQVSICWLTEIVECESSIAFPFSIIFGILFSMYEKTNFKGN